MRGRPTPVMLDPICEIAWPIHSLRKSGSSLNPFPTISRVSHKDIDHLCLHTWALQGVAEHFRGFPSLAKNVCRFYILEMRFGGHFEVSPKHGRSRSFSVRQRAFYFNGGLSGMLTCTGLLQCLLVIPWHPGGGMLGQFGGVILQYGEVVEGIGAIQFAGMNEAHVQVAHLRPVAGFIEERILATMTIFP